MKVFVYGTLRRGEHNHRLLLHSTFVREAWTEARFRLVDLGRFPGMTKGRRAVNGEVYDVDPTTLARLDRLEGHPSFYRRSLIRLDDGSEVETYLLTAEQVLGCPMIDSGNWIEYFRMKEERHAP